MNTFTSSSSSSYLDLNSGDDKHLHSLSNNSASGSIVFPKSEGFQVTTPYDNHTHVTKPLKTKYISLDTKFCEEYHNSLSVAAAANYHLNLPERITSVQSIALSSVHLPLTFYNISAALQNNTLALVFNHATTVITVPDGNYTISTLTSTINGLLPNSMSFTIPTFGFSQFSFTADSTDTSLTIRFDTDSSGNPNKLDLKSRLGWVLGFRVPTFTFPSVYPANAVLSTCTSQGIVDVSTVKYLFLILDEFSTSSHSSSFHSFLPRSILNKNILGQISIDSTKTFGQFQNATLNNGLLISDVRHFQGDRLDLQKCNVQLVNEFGKVLSLNHNDFSFVLELKHY